MTHYRISRQATPAATGIGRGQVAFGHAAKQLGDVGDAESRGVVGAHFQGRHDLPIQAYLVVHVFPEQVVVGVAHGGIERQALGDHAVLQQRHGKLGEGFLGRVLTGDRILLIRVGNAQHRQRIGITPTTLLADLDARGKAHPAGRHLEELAADVGREALLVVAAVVARPEKDVVEDLGGQIAVAEVVTARNRGTGGVAAQRGVERVIHPVQIGHIGRAIHTGVAAPVQRGRPVPVHAELAFDARDHAEGIGLLEELARTGLFQTAALQQQVLSGRIGRVTGRNVDRAIDTQAAGRGQLVGLAVGEHQLGEHARGFIHRAVAE